MIYIEKNEGENIPKGSDGALAMYGAIESGINYKLVTFNTINGFKNDFFMGNIFIGTIDFMNLVFNKLKTTPRVPYNSNRKSELSTIEEIINRVSESGQIFIKPYNNIKLFTGLVVDKFCINFLCKFPLSTKVLTYPVINNIRSEWRLYISQGKIVGSKNYLGDFEISPDYDFARAIIEENSIMLPETYTMDIGITDTENFVVEFNDMWAIGNYGIDNELYLRLLKRRYVEIIKNI